MVQLEKRYGQHFRTSTWVSKCRMDKEEEANCSLFSSSMFPNLFSALLCPAVHPRRPAAADCTFGTLLNQPGWFKQWETPARVREVDGGKLCDFFFAFSLLHIASLIFPTGQPFFHSSSPQWASISSFLPLMPSVLQVVTASSSC